MRLTILMPLLVVALATRTSAQATAYPRVLPPDITAVISEAGRIDGRSAWSLTESPDGRFDAFMSFDDTIRVYDRRTRKTHSLPQSIPGSAELNWSRRGGMISFARTDDGSRQAFPWIMPVDPTTGLSTGPARQLSMRPTNRLDDAPSFTPDDRFAAFASNSADSGYVLVVSSNGGRERTLYATIGHVGRATISADGKWVYFSARKPGPVVPELLYRVAFTGGPAQALGSIGFFIGVSADSKQVAWYAEGHPRSSASPTIVIGDAEGKPLGVIRDVATKGWGAKPGVLLVKKVDFPFAVRVVPTAGGPVAMLGAVGPNASPYAWSPDSKLLLTTGGSGATPRWLILRSNGDTVRQIDAPAQANIAGVSLKPAWSPDGRFIAYRARSTDDRAIAPRVMVIEVATGRSRMLAELQGWRIHDLRWRSDSKAVMALHATADSQAVSEIDVTGAVKRLASGLAAPARARFLFATDSTILSVGLDSISLMTSRGVHTRWIQALHRRSTLFVENDVGLSRDGQTIAIMKDAPGSETKHSIEIIPVTGGAARTINYDLAYSAFNPHITGDAVAFLGNVRGQHANITHGTDLFIVSSSGGAPRNLTSTDAMSDIDEVVVSPDGRFIAYQAELTPQSTRILDVDVSSAGRAKPKAKP